MPITACLECGDFATRGSRCPAHTRVQLRRRRRTTAYVYDDPRWVRLSKRRIAAHVREHGWVCPGLPELGHEPHLTTDLTLDHRVPVTLGGAPFDEANTQVLCRSVNTAKRWRDRENESKKESRRGGVGSKEKSSPLSKLQHDRLR